MTAATREFAVLPFELGALVSILLVARDEAGGWRLPQGATRKGLNQHTVAALEAQKQVGVSGQIYKRPLYPHGPENGISIFPLLVQAEAPTRTGDANRFVTRWVPAPQAAELIDADLRPAIEALVDRLSRSTRLSHGPKPLVSARDRT